jgi:hypothetical protein
LPASAKPPTAAGQGEVNIHAPINASITVQGSAGTPEQNEQLAKQMGRQLDRIVRATIVDEIMRQRRPGNFCPQQNFAVLRRTANWA